MHPRALRTGTARSIVGRVVLTGILAALSIGCVYVTVPGGGPGEGPPETTVRTMYPGWTVGSADAGATAVNSPDYWLDFSGYSVKVDVNRVVQSTTGAVGLKAGAHPGESYVVDTAQDLGWSFGAVDAAYTAGSPALLATPIAEFALAGTTLPLLRNVIVLHTQDGVKSYQVLRVTFNAPR